MSKLIVIRIIPQTPTEADTFTDFLNPPSPLGKLKITAFDLTFDSVDNPSPGIEIGSASYIDITPSGGWIKSSGGTDEPPQNTIYTDASKPKSSPTYPSGSVDGIIQQVDFEGPFGKTKHVYELKSVATAMIEVKSPTTFENLRLQVEWGSQVIPLTVDFYDVNLPDGPAPDLSAWPPPTSNQPDFWAQQAQQVTSLFLTLPPPPSATNPFAFQMPSDGTPPPFDPLLNAVNAVLKTDPSGPTTATTTGSTAVGDTTLQFAATTTGIAVGMAVSGTGIPAGTTVVEVNPPSHPGQVILSQEVTAAIAIGATITFTPNLPTLSFAQCRNIAYEIIWRQQPPVPAPPEALEDIYTNPPNNGVLLSGSTPNQNEGDRQQFEGQLKSYYTVPDTTADRLTQFIFALSAAVAAEQLSLSATQAILQFPVTPGQPSSAPLTDAQVVLTAIPSIDPSVGFGVPAGYFYALAAMMPAEITPQTRYQIATGDKLPHLLTDLTAAINTGMISDAEPFVTPLSSPPTTPVSAAQAARRIVALGVPPGSATPLAPLDTVELLTTADAASGKSLSFAATDSLAKNMLVTGPGIAPGTKVSAVAAPSVTLDTPILNDVPAGASIVFTPAYSSGLQSLIQSWLEFPATTGGQPSSQTYQPTDDDAKFWPGAAVANPQDFLSLVLSALTRGFVIPPPFSVALGDKINDFLTKLAKPGKPTVATLAALTVQQWNDFFQPNPTWLPPFTVPGNTKARIAAFVRYAQKFFEVGIGGPPSSIDLATIAPTLAVGAGNDVLHFAATNAVVVGMAASGQLSDGTVVVGSGTTVLTVNPVATGTDVQLSQAVSADVPIGTNITFTPNLSTSSTSSLPLLQEPSTDWLHEALKRYGAFTFGKGFDVTKLRTAAGKVFANDPAAQDWLVDALVTIDALYQVMNPVQPKLPPLPNTPAYVFSIVEALYARGFKSAADITRLSGPDFQKAVVGTVAYGTSTVDLAGLIYASAFTIAPPSGSGGTGSGGFQPVNDGSLTNCIPPSCFSPLGPISYLQALLRVSEDGTCDHPFGSPLVLVTNDDTLKGQNTLFFDSTSGVSNGMSVSGLNIPANTTITGEDSGSVTLSQPVSALVPEGTSITFTAATLGSAISTRRGPIGNLAATCANCDTPLPLIDIVNECLEFMASLAKPTSGTVYDTSSDALAQHPLCHEEPCPEKDDDRCHEPCRIFAALPEYSSPGTPVDANQAVEPLVYNNLKTDFSSCCLPYSQALDVSRTYLRHFHSCRFEEMRTFRKCITEFVLDPVNEPTGFQSHLWRLPVRVDIAIEYLGITPEEYSLLFAGAAPPPCASATTTGGGTQPNPGGGSTTPGAVHANAGSGELAPWQLYGFPSPGDVNPWTQVVVQLPEFLKRTCLSYCEFFELWQSGFVQFSNGADQPDGTFPQCEPCCLDRLSLQFPDGQGVEQALLELAVFIRLWRKLRESCCFCYSFAQLRDICDVLHLFNGGVINQDFIRRLAAFQIFRDHFRLELVDKADKPAPGAVDDARTHLLALWVGPSAAKWKWAVQQLLESIEHYAQRHHKRDRRAPEFVKLLASNLDPLSRLAGFDPGSATDNWHFVPTHTLRFAEVLAKIYASDFTIGEIFYLFTAGDHLDGDDPFPLDEQNEALDSPLDLPDEQPEYSLWHLRRKLLDVRVSDEDVHEWHWKRIAAELHEDFGFAPADILAFGQHFFPETLGHAGHHVDSAARRFTSGLDPGKTSTPMWNIPAEGPFQYDETAKQLSTQIPLSDRAVIAKLTHVHTLGDEEQHAVQDLYFQPRAMLSTFALLFSDFAAAQRYLIEEREEKERWNYFRRQFLLCHRRARIIAEHLAHHVAAVTGQKHPEGDSPAWIILRELFADENKATASWENDAGTTPPVTWTPPPIGGAFAALLGLTGTGLLAEYQAQGGSVVWRDVSGSLSAFGMEANKVNCPVLTVLPAMNTKLTPEQMKFVSVLNGFLMKDSTGAWLGGAQGFHVSWTGALLVDHDGTYEFWAGAPTPGEEKPDFEAAEHRRWRVMLKRGQRTWVLLSHHWSGEEEQRYATLPLKRGAYEITIDFIQPEPEFTNDEHVRPQHTGFQIKYLGPDTRNERMQLPHNRLFAVLKGKTLGDNVPTLGLGASTFLNRLYVSSLRDIRRTYQRAFKAALFAHRFRLSGRRQEHGTSELGYMLAQEADFASFGYYHAGAIFKRHAAGFDFNFFPLLDTFHPPTDDLRTNPTPQRMQAMFDWWERLFDYTVVRRDVKECHDRHLWYLFDEAQEKHPAQPGSLLRHMGADSRHWELDLRYYQGQSVAVYKVSSADLEDDRWTVRAWHADRWLRALECFFTVKDITKARPDLWASDDPSALVAGETETGNANLSAFLCDGCFENGHPRRYEDVKRLNDGLRERARHALASYLCQMNRVALPWPGGAFATVPRDLNDLLLLDVETGICERASRIDEAITAVQTFVRRARLHLEPGFEVSYEFARMWDREFATFRIWQACKRRHLYKENYVEWSDFEKARFVESFRFLESKLRGSELTVAEPGGLEWWPDELPPEHETLKLLQKEPSTIEILPDAREGLNLLGTPERDARPSWLTLVPPADLTGGGTGDTTPKKPLASVSSDVQLPFWMEAAIRLGTRFYRVDAAGVPPAAVPFRPHESPEEKGCVTCCEECGCCHPALVDEYYFWLIDGEFYDPPVTPTPTGFTAPPAGDYQEGYQLDFYDPFQQEAALWQDTTQLPQLLLWDRSPMVRLGWCRVHNGEFQQPRRSQFGVPIQTGSSSPADLVFLGRTADSLTFSVTNAVPPEGFADSSDPGFRYDLALDDAVVLPLVTLPPKAPTFLTLPAYPYFVFDTPGDSLFPLSPFSPSLAVARALRSHCQFEAALNWYRLAFDPLAQDCTWIHCEQNTRPAPPTNTGGGNTPGANNPNVPSNPAVVRMDVAPPPQRLPGSASACCDSTNITCDQARNRSVLLHYLETLVEWGDAVMRRGNSPEAYQQARVIFDAAAVILGQSPVDVRLQPPAITETVISFTSEFPPLNPRLLDLYTVVRDRLAMLHECLNSRRLYNAEGCRLHYFGSDPLCDGKVDYCAEESQWCYLRSPYRFMYLIQKAQEYASKAQELGAALLSAFEKGDAEYLSSLRAGQERELLALALQSKQDQWRDADWQVEALQKTKAVSQANLIYYNGLIDSGPGGLIDDEIQYQTLMSAALSLRGTANITEGIGAGLRFIPDIVLGLAGFGGSPVAISWIPLGTKIGDALEATARIINNVGEIKSLNAGLDQTKAGWERRLDEWTHQTQILAIEIQQIERQILAAQRRRDQTLQDLNTHQRQIEQSAEVLDFLRDKFTAHDLYLFLQKETAALYAKTYDLALFAARQAQHAFNLERGHTSRRFLPECAWDSLHEGLMAGERLSTALRRMEKAYADENVREYELTKHFSLRLHFPEEFLRLRATGYCEIELREWMYDLDFPGHYMRRIKNVTLTIPCVTAPFTGVHCRLTLLASQTRVHPWLKSPAHECCCPPEACCSECGEEERVAREYEPCPDDPRVVRCYGSCEAIATSTGQNDSGLFELNFNDERYLPFEFMGAVCRLRIELPAENNFFDMNTLSDLMLRMNFTAREGGTLLRRAANAYAQRHLPGDGWCFFDVHRDFADAWQLFLDTSKDEDAPHGEERSRRLRLRLDRRMFPFVPGGEDLRVTEIAILFDADPEDDADCSCPEIEGCPCPHRAEPARRIIEFSREREDGESKQHRDREEHRERAEHRERYEHSKRADNYEHKEDRKRKEHHGHEERHEHGEYCEHEERRDRERPEDHERKEGYKHKEGCKQQEGYEHQGHHEAQAPPPVTEGYKHPEGDEDTEDYERKQHYERRKDYDRDDDDELSVSCVASEAWPDLYSGMFRTRIGPLGRGRHSTVEFRFPRCVGEVERVYLLLRYTVEGRCHDSDRPRQRQLCGSSTRL